MSNEVRTVLASALPPALSTSGTQKARTLVAYLSDQPDLAVSLGAVLLAELIPTYQRRLRRFLRSEGPVCHGLDRFVETLGGDGSAEMFAIQSDATGWIGLLRPDGSMLDVTSVDRT